MMVPWIDHVFFLLHLATTLSPLLNLTGFLFDEDFAFLLSCFACLMFAASCLSTLGLSSRGAVRVLIVLPKKASAGLQRFFPDAMLFIWLRLSWILDERFFTLRFVVFASFLTFFTEASACPFDSGFSGDEKTCVIPKDSVKSRIFLLVKHEPPSEIALRGRP